MENENGTIIEAEFTVTEEDNQRIVNEGREHVENTESDEDENEVDVDETGELTFKPKVAAQKLGVTEDALRTNYMKLYGDEPYLKPYIRYKGKHRRYTEKALDVLSNIIKLSKLDKYNVEQIKEIMRKNQAGLPARLENAAVLEFHKIAERLENFDFVVDEFKKVVSRQAAQMERLENKVDAVKDEIAKKVDETLKNSGIAEEVVEKVLGVIREEKIKQIEETKEQIHKLSEGHSQDVKEAVTLGVEEYVRRQEQKNAGQQGQEKKGFFARLFSK